MDGGAPPAGCVCGVWPSGSVGAVGFGGDDGEVAGILLLVGGDGVAYGVDDGVCFGFEGVEDGADAHGHGFAPGFPGSGAAVIDACYFGDVVGGKCIKGESRLNPSNPEVAGSSPEVYQRAVMIESQLSWVGLIAVSSVSKGIGD